jgi:hypothetical protein
VRGQELLNELCVFVINKFDSLLLKVTLFFHSKFEIDRLLINIEIRKSTDSLATKMGYRQDSGLLQSQLYRTLLAYRLAPLVFQAALPAPDHLVRMTVAENS